MNPSRQSGNILFSIFIGIALFAALSYAVSSGMRTGSANLSKEKTSLIANEMLQYGNELAQAIKVLRTLHGCSETQISFENPVVNGYENATTPADNSCKIFHPAGGGLKLRTPDLSWLDPAHNTDPNFGRWVITPKYCGLDVGTGGSTCAAQNTELGLILPAVRKETCDEINAKLGSAIFYPSNGSGYNFFTGSYSDFPTMISPNVNMSGKKIFCFQYNGKYSFYYTLLAR